MKTPTKEMGIVMTRPEATSGEATPIDPCVTARGYSHRCERGTFGCDRMHLPPEAVTIATLRARIAALEAESQADKRLIDRLTVVCEDCPDDSHCESCDDSGVVPPVRVHPCHDADAVPGEVVVWSDGHEHRFVPTSSYAALEAEKAELASERGELMAAAESYLFRSVPDPNVGAHAEDRLRALLARLKGGG